MKFQIGNESLNFKMTNQTVFNIDERFDNYGEVINGLMQGKNLYSNAIKLMSCCCIEKELNVNKMIDVLTPEQIHHELVDFALDLYFEYRGIKTKSDKPKEENSKKK